MCLNSVTLSLYLSITLVRARCYHNECICLMCSVGEVQEVDSRLTCYNLSCCYVRKRWGVLFLCLICYYVYIYTGHSSVLDKKAENSYFGSKKVVFLLLTLTPRITIVNVICRLQYVFVTKLLTNTQPIRNSDVPIVPHHTTTTQTFGI